MAQLNQTWRRLAMPVALGAVIGASAFAQTAMAPVNDAPNPYTTIENHFKLPEGRVWGSTSAVDIDRDGKSIWVGERCGANSCWDRDKNQMIPVPVILKFDESGKLVRSFGTGVAVFPHGIHVDRDGNIWVTDARTPTAEDLAKYPDARGKGSVVVKFSPDGRVLMRLGTPGVRGNPPAALAEPTAAITDPNGDVYVAESHMDVTDPQLIARISVFDKRGRFLRSMGRAGTGPGEFRTPHALAFDSKGNLVVADRQNHRIQLLSKNGAFLREYADFSRVSGLVIDRRDVIYATDSESAEAVHPGWSRGVRIGSLMDGRVTTFIPPHKTDGPDGAMGEGIAIDPRGDLYTAESILRGVTKYVAASTGR